MNDSPRTPLHREDSLPVDNQRVLSGRYELGALIGRGGMADVHSGLDTRLGRTVAIKLLRPDMARDPQFQARFKREAQSVAALNHPSIVAIYDTGEHLVQDGSEDSVRVPYIVMEFVEGKTLRDLIRAKEVSIDRAIEFCLGVLAALEYSHKAGIVHRDIKPANVMHCEGSTNSVKVMDFGIARAMADSSATMTQTQAVVGTAQYLSPEQARGETVDARSDLYSAACLLYEMLTGRPPFVGDSPVSVAYQHVREIPEPPSSLNPDVSSALDSVLAKALQKNRDDRFQDAAAFRRALRAARAGVAVPALPATEAPTDPNDHVPTPGAPATEAFAVSGTSFLDDAPTGRYSLTDINGGGATIAHASAPLELQDADILPLSFPPERERTARQKSRRRTWIATLVILTLLVLAGGGLWLFQMLNQPPPPPPKVEVPVVTSLTESAALQRLWEANLRPEIERQTHETVPKGTAIGTDPEAGASLDPNAEVILNISEGPSTLKIPENLPGQTEAAARDILRQTGLVGAPSTTEANSATVPRGRVITTSPSPGQMVAPGSTVEIIVSTGKVAMPELRGSTRAEAEAALQNLGLVPNIQEVENSQVEAGRVTDQSEPGNSAVDQGKTINVVVAKAPPPPPSPTPTPTPTPTRTSDRDRD